VNTNKSSFIEEMKAHSVQTSFHYPPIHTFTAYERSRDKASLLLTEAVAEKEVTLPLYPTLREEDVVTVAQAVAEALRAS
jgi:dTDP-4-amino-4,6-dideoxygalactose transaminase